MPGTFDCCDPNVAFLRSSRQPVESAIKILLGQGLIRRTPHPTDRRSTIAQITPAGRSQLQKAIKRLNSDLFRDLGLTGDEVQTLIALLTKLRRSWSDVERCLTHEEPASGQRMPIAGQARH